jgi:anti-anti-sigma factor
MSLLQISITENTPDTKVVTLNGAADATNVTEINNEVLAALAGVQMLVIDGTGLTFANSTFIGYLTDWYSRLQDRGGKLVLAGLTMQVKDTLSVVGLLNLIPNYITVADALGKPSGRQVTHQL